MAEIVALLEKEYCPPIDSALLSAILSDYDFSDDNALQEVRGTLDELKLSALVEENTEFDPSGSSGSAVCCRAETENGASEQADSCPEWGGGLASQSEDTDLTSLTQSLSSLGAADTTKSGSDQRGESSDTLPELEHLDTQGKENMLREMFPSMKTLTISHTLKACRGNFSRTVEDLLNQVFFEEEPVDGEKVARGIEAFADENTPPRKRKGKGKKKRDLRDTRIGCRRSSSLPPTMIDAGYSKPASSRWETAKDDIEFVSSRTGIAQSSISSVYHSNGASLSATIQSIVDNENKGDVDLDSEDPVIQMNAYELGQDFPTILPAHLLALVRLTHPSTASAHELARVLVAKRQHNQPSGLEIITNYAPINVPETVETPPRPADIAVNFSQASAAALASSYSTSRQTAFTQASAAYRRGKSDRLMSAAAAYYSNLGRDYDAKVKGYSAAAAEALVSSQSSGTELDLHGVSVKDAVRIAREKVTSWWVGLGDGRIGGRAGIGTGYRIVTGVGRHSEGGKGRIGPAVASMLVKEGWKIEVGEGVVVVTGVARPR
ncbi:MAG: hypothetical protein M1819_001835 [Sarea resinae]|nr:MAG: hypothetical protein M1819_001835 [Sarea resinae]